MQDIGGMIGGIVTTLSVLGAGVAFLIRRRDSQKDPIPKQTAAVSLSERAMTMMSELTDDLREELRRQEERHGRETNAMQGQIQILTARVTSVEETNRHHERMFSGALSYIESLLRHIRDGGTRPTTPSDLRDLIDPDLLT